MKKTILILLTGWLLTGLSVFAQDAVILKSDGSVSIGGTGSARLVVTTSTGPAILSVGDLLILEGNFAIGTESLTERVNISGNVTADDYLYNSSIEYKTKIESLSESEAKTAFEKLNPIKYRYRNDPEEGHVGFIAEDVPELVATKNRKSLSPMDIVAVLTKVMQEQQKTISELTKEMEEIKKEMKFMRSLAMAEAN